MTLMVSSNNANEKKYIPIMHYTRKKTLGVVRIEIHRTVDIRFDYRSAQS